MACVAVLKQSTTKSTDMTPIILSSNRFSTRKDMLEVQMIQHPSKMLTDETLISMINDQTANTRGYNQTRARLVLNKISQIDANNVFQNLNKIYRQNFEKMLEYLTHTYPTYGFTTHDIETFRIEYVPTSRLNDVKIIYFEQDEMITMDM